MNRKHNVNVACLRARLAVHVRNLQFIGSGYIVGQVLEEGGRVGLMRNRQPQMKIGIYQNHQRVPVAPLQQIQPTHEPIARARRIVPGQESLHIPGGEFRPGKKSGIV